MLTRRQVCQGLVAPVFTSKLGAQPAETVTVGGRSLRLAQLPPGLAHHPETGLLIAGRGQSQLIHALKPPQNWCGEARCTITPGGDYLLMFTAGSGHYGGRSEKVNDMVAYRSADHGKTWTGPSIAWQLPYNQHGFVPLQPRGTKRMYAFGTEPFPDRIEDRENAPIGFRSSDDDGRAWSNVTLIRPRNDADYLGMFVMRMCETGSGTWLLAPHSGMSRNPRHTKVYIMRSTDRGQTWTLIPGPRPNGWTEPKYGRMEEGRPISLGRGKVLLITRTAEGHLWQLRSNDDGITWTGPEPTTLVHPLAPPMVFHLSDGKTLAAFHHNRYTGGESNSPSGTDRSELWVSLSHDGGESWSEPRFVLANANQPMGRGAFAESVSYIDAVAERGTLHLFISHQFRQVVQVSFPEGSLTRLPSKAELTQA